MCGVIGLICDRNRDDLGQTAGVLLETLQYRGYDSTGAAIQAEGLEVTLLKDVGPPSELIHSLGIVKQRGQIFCGQVRWATFGAVDQQNAQPHVVRCKTFLYGAHNGNVTNTDELEGWLRAEGHEVVSNNDGEMVVHTVEHFFAAELAKTDDRDLAMRRGIVRACERLEGSFAAVIVDPVTRTVYAIKRGSSLYFGVGEGFAIASSDLSSVLGQTKALVSLAVGEFVRYDAGSFQVYRAEGDAGTPLDKAPARSRLRVEDAALRPPFETFMDQEIHAQPEAVRDALRLFTGGSDAARAVGALELDRAGIELALDALRGEYEDEALGACFDEHRARFESLSGANVAEELASTDAALFADLLRLRPADAPLILGLDAFVEHHEVEELATGVADAIASMRMAVGRGGRIVLCCCGTSFHAAKAASLFFADLAGVEVTPLLPGELRGQHAKTVRDGDLLVAVSQSGETKDLIDAIDLVMSTGHEVGCIAVVNNVNSTLAQEKADTVIPLRCGPEIAVPATKSFLNQLTIFYGLAHRLGCALGRELPPIPDLAGLVRDTLETAKAPVDAAAARHHLAPSMHILATRLLAVAKEGALKIREVVLNHTEGFEGSEFKHGPNTILGFNTLFGPAQVEALLARIAGGLGDASPGAADAAAFVREALGREIDALYADYPLVFVTGPERRDVDLTISQIHTHKIRGASVVMIAEDDERLRAAAMKAPAGADAYQADYIPLPPTGDTLQTVFSASVALQLLALRMSERKMAYLDALGVPDHGVHPDVPKNVSKSITVD